MTLLRMTITLSLFPESLLISALHHLMECPHPQPPFLFMPLPFSSYGLGPACPPGPLCLEIKSEVCAVTGHLSLVEPSRLLA